MTEPRDLWLEIIEEMEARRQKGLVVYGVPVAPDEAVDWAKHSEEEKLDDIVYTRALREVLTRARDRIRELEETNEGLKTDLRLLKLSRAVQEDEQSLWKRLNKGKLSGPEAEKLRERVRELEERVLGLEFTIECQREDYLLGGQTRYQEAMKERVGQLKAIIKEGVDGGSVRTE